MGIFVYNPNPKRGQTALEPIPEGGFPLMRYLLRDHFWELLSMNIVACLLCIPILTIPAALCARDRVLLKLANGDGFLHWSEFWVQFRHGLLRYLPFFLFSVVILTIGVLSYLCGTAIWEHTSIMGLLCMACGFLLVLLTLLTNSYAYKLFAMLDLPTSVCIQNAALLAISQWKTNLQTMLFPGLVLVLLFLLLPLSIPFLLVLFPFFTGLMECCLQRPMLNRLVFED